MRLDIHELFEEPQKTLDYKQTWQPDNLDLESDHFHLFHPLKVEFEVTNDDGVIRAWGSYRGTLEGVCSRCLDRFETSLKSSVEAKFLPEGQTESKQDHEEQVISSNVEDETIDLGDVVRQNILVHRPMKPLCRSDCQGLCPVCGQNRNESDCGHEQEFMDPRLAQLQEMEPDNPENP